MLLSPKPIVLVHGAWLDASAWERVVPLLADQGYDVTAVNLPGHGDDHTPYAQIQLQSYVDAVLDAIGNRHGVTLVGHSLAGVVISQVAEAIPDQLAKLVYVAAYLPRNGESLYGLSQQDNDSHIGTYWRQDDPAHYSPAYIAPEGIKECFAADCDDETVQRLIDRHKPDALAPMATPVSLSPERFGRVSKAYVHTRQDKAVSYSLQQLMVDNTPVDDVYSLDSSHCPFFSRPAELARLLMT